MKNLFIVLLVFSTSLIAEECDPSKDSLLSAIKCYDQGYDSYNSNIANEIEKEKLLLESVVNESADLEKKLGRNVVRIKSLNKKIRDVKKFTKESELELDYLKNRYKDGEYKVQKIINYIEYEYHQIKNEEERLKKKREIIKLLNEEIYTLNSDIIKIKEKIKSVKYPIQPLAPLPKIEPTTKKPEEIINRPQCLRSDLEKRLPILEKNIGDCQDSLLVSLGKVTLDTIYDSLSIKAVLEITKKVQESYRQTSDLIQVAKTFIKESSKKFISILNVFKNTSEYVNCGYLNFSCPIL